MNQEVIPMLSKAREICVEKHAGQVDKEGQPYYLHPFTVAKAVEGEAAKTVADEGKKAGWSDERIEFVKSKIMGLKVTYDEKPAED